jgi:hypothetical protein
MRQGIEKTYSVYSFFNKLTNFLNQNYAKNHYGTHGFSIFFALRYQGST